MAAAIPFILIYVSVGVAMVGAVVGWASGALYLPAALARALLPAAVAHLALVFPRPREIVRRVPRLTIVPYGAALVLGAAELDAAYGGSAATMMVVQRILIAAASLAFSLLCLSCFLAIRESPSLLERRQARAFLVGMLALFLGTLLLGFAGVPGGVFSVVTLAAAFSPLPLGYAIARYHLFDLDVAVRRLIANGLYLSICTSGLFLVMTLLRDWLHIPEILRSPPVLFASLYAILAPADAARHVVKRAIAKAVHPARGAWEGLAQGRVPEMTTLADPEEVARLVCTVLKDGLHRAEVSIFLECGSAFRLSHASGPGACTDPLIAALASRLWDGLDPVDLNRIDLLDPAALRVHASGVEASCPIGTHEAPCGCILISPHRRGMLLSASHLAWMRTIAAQAAAAIENARLAEDLRIAELFAAKGRMHAELAHEIGKPLGTLEILARHLRAESGDPERAADRALAIERLAKQLRGIVRGVLAPDSRSGEADPVAPEDVIHRACNEIALIHGSGRVIIHPLPALPALPPGSERLVRALTNLLDNALRSVRPVDAVEIRARLRGDCIEIEIRDRGCGIAQASFERAFEPFFSDRVSGTGLGLPISRQIVEQLGGRLLLASDPLGTVATVRVPVAADRPGNTPRRRPGAFDEV